MAYAGFKRTYGFKQTFFQIFTNSHYLTGSLHLGAQSVGNGVEFIKGETGKLCYHVIKSGLKGSVGVGNGNFLQGHTHSYFCGYAGNGISAGFGCKRGGTGNSGVYLDQVIIAVFGVECVLYVTAAFYFKLADDLDRAVVKLFVMLGREGEYGSHNYRVAGVNANGVDIFHTANGNGFIVAVTHNLKFNFLVALNALFNKNLMHGGKLECVCAYLHKLFFVVCKSAAGTAESESGTKYNGVADLFCSLLCLLKIIGYFGGDNGLADRLAKLLEHFSVLCTLNAFAAGAKQFNSAFLQNALFLKLHCKVKTGLTADTGNDSVGTLITEYFCHVFKGKGFHIHLIGNGGVCHNGCGVGVNQHNLVAFFFKCKTRLSACIVKFRRLTDNDRAGADYKYLFKVCSLCHFCFLRYILYTIFPSFTVSTHSPYRVSPSKGVAFPIETRSSFLTVNAFSVSHRVKPVSEVIPNRFRGFIHISSVSFSRVIIPVFTRWV